MKTKDLFRQLPAKARILFVRLRSMGDCLLLTSPIQALKQEHPEFRLSVLVEDRFAGCFAGNPDFEHVIAVGNKYSAGLRLLFRRYHAIVNLHGGPTSLAYTCLAWGKRIGAEQYQYPKLYHDLVPVPRPDVHTVQSTLDTFRALGLRAEEPPPLRYEIQPIPAQRMRETFKGRPYAVLHPAALMTTKRWDPDRFAAIGRSLQQQGLRIVLTCGPGEESIVGKVASAIPQSTIMLGLTIPELAELIRTARLYLGNDSGPMHLAAAVGTPTIAVWGSSDARRWRPWKVEHRVVQNSFECNPCPGYRCHIAESPLCIESVTVDQVRQAVREVIQQQQAVKQC